MASAAAAVGAGFWAREDLEAATQNVNTNSRPSDLKITDMRIAMISRGGRRGIPVIRLDTNQGIHGLGEVRVSVSGVITMVKARSDDEDGIKAPTPVRVLRLLDKNTVLVQSSQTGKEDEK